MSEIKFVELKCQRCGGGLEEKSADLYICTCCGKEWKEEKLYDFTDMLNACEEANRRQRVADIAKLRQLLWKEISKENVSNIEVKKWCERIIAFLPDDFYANFFLATCSKSKTELDDFLFAVDVKERLDDIPLMLDYLLNALKTEWTMGVSNFIEKIKPIDTALFHKYRTRFEEEKSKNDSLVFRADFPRHAFIAYSSKDMPKVRKLVTVLEAADITCFVAERNMRHGSGSVENYEKVIQTAIDNCSVLVFVSSDNSRSIDCDAYEKELKYVNQKRKDMPRVEYLIEDYKGKDVKPAEPIFKKFFDGHEYCLSPEDVAVRVTEIIMDGEPAPVENPVETPVKTTVGTPVETPVKTTVGTPVETPKETTVGAHIETFKKKQPNTDPVKTKQPKKFKTEKKTKTVPVFNDERDEIYKKGIKLKRSKLLGSVWYGVVFAILVLGWLIFVLYDNLFGAIFNYWWIDLIVFYIAIMIILVIMVVIMALCFDRFNKEQKAANIYEQGLESIKKYDYKKAVKFYSKAAELGFAKAQNALGDCYYNGNGVTKDYITAVKWYQLAAELGCAEAQYNLGYCLKRGQGVRISLSESTEWLKKSALKGNKKELFKKALLEFEDEPKKELKRKYRTRRAFKVITSIFTVLITFALFVAFGYGSVGLSYWLLDTAEKDGMTFIFDDGGYILTKYTGDETDLVIPEKVRGIKVVGISNALQNNTTIESITIPDSVTSIYSYAFQGCTSLTNITIGDGVTYIENNVFKNTAYYNNSDNWEDGVLYIGNYLIEANSEISSNYNIREDTTLIASHAFNSNLNLESVTIPDSVSHIGIYVFCNCTSLTSINVNSKNTAYKSIDGNLYSYDGKTLIQYAVGKTDMSFVVSDSVQTINYGAFNSASLESVTIGGNVTSIGHNAFYNCTSLSYITIPAKVKSIGYRAFYNCTALKEVTFEKTNWKVSPSSSFSDSVKIDVADTSSAATYLTSTYTDYYWKRG